jgi:hypothetical protein
MRVGGSGSSLGSCSVLRRMEERFCANTADSEQCNNACSKLNVRKVILESLGGMIIQRAKPRHCKLGNRVRSRNFEFRYYHVVLALCSLRFCSAFVVGVEFGSVVDRHPCTVLAQTIVIFSTGLRHNAPNGQKEKERNEGAIFQAQSLLWVCESGGNPGLDSDFWCIAIQNPHHVH